MGCIRFPDIHLVISAFNRMLRLMTSAKPSADLPLTSHQTAPFSNYLANQTSSIRLGNTVRVAIDSRFSYGPPVPHFQIILKTHCALSSFPLTLFHGSKLRFSPTFRVTSPRTRAPIRNSSGCLDCNSPLNQSGGPQIAIHAAQFSSGRMLSSELGGPRVANKAGSTADESLGLTCVHVDFSEAAAPYHVEWPRTAVQTPELPQSSNVPGTGRLGANATRPCSQHHPRRQSPGRIVSHTAEKVTSERWATVNRRDRPAILGDAV